MFYEDLELSNCPEKFALNCKRYDVMCHACKANGTGKHLKYLPIDKSIVPHPVNIKQKTTTSYSRKGRQEEKKLIRNDKYLVSTYASGSVGHDGDAILYIPKIGYVRTEIKFRFTANTQKQFTPTTKEIREGQEQGIKVWYVQKGVANPKAAVYIEYELMRQIMAVLVLSDRTKVTNFNQYKAHRHYGQIVLKDHPRTLNYDLGVYEVKRGTKTPKTIIWAMGWNLIKSPVGWYVLMTKTCWDHMLGFLNCV